ncbi:hypothetical protein Acy02nite_46920 [Actinoplanes cyaneus]|uniref:Uncharacterized protein n=1 Tax=Actinoplanes cyaneus TaxID=52696 RepID=A0A919IKM1_9ACTN|nr:hypothetical protein [Actinoplanes cyaneus]MCW2138852.1 hypothetical protein [Actinoplanes cyaneus]GID66811.1 hypothetical protein Acy02nite_46920 [Actinoplanes cyaneus]
MKTAEVLSIIAIGMSTVSLGWQIVSWRRSGALIRATVNQALVGHEGIWCTNVTARNLGRMAVSVTNWGYQLPGRKAGNIFMTRPLPISPTLPHRLEAGAEVSFYMETDAIQQVCKQKGLPYQRVRAWVDLGDGRRIKARRRGIGLK